MNLLFQLLLKFCKKEYIKVFLLFTASLVINVIQTKNISKLTANIINSLKENNQNDAFGYFKSFVFFSVVLLIVYYGYQLLEDDLITKIRQWTRSELLKTILKMNNENLSEKNFMYISSPINRLSVVSFSILSEIITFIIPTLLFLIIIMVYFFSIDFHLGIVFAMTNVLIFFFMFMVIPDIMKKDDIYEAQSFYNENYQLELLSNMDKVIYRGQINPELNKFKTISDKTTENAYSFYTTADTYNFITNSIVNILLFYIVYFIIIAFFNKKLSLVLVITILNIILLYKERMAALLKQVIDFIEFIGRSHGVLHFFEDIDDIDFVEKNMRNYDKRDLDFETIRFENVYFKYKSHNKPIFENLNLTLSLNHKIIGFTGPSGRGKTTLIKLILKMYTHYRGNIYIDDVNIRDIDADYIRENITYVNQSSKLFDRKVIENIMYGCSNADHCEGDLKFIIEKYPKIRELLNGIDIMNKDSGALGENLSGGQRQIINIVGGLINPSKITILDEPTNALDGALKKDVIDMIRYFLKNKKCIMVITHDIEIKPIFDQVIEL
jgi:ABC-type bacteriocin/lantibiotic exporter with double-glycine peptidase domain